MGGAHLLGLNSNAVEVDPVDHRLERGPGELVL